jgi:hypothetical protein
MKKNVLHQFWSIYDHEGTVQALNWLESLKYFEQYCQFESSDEISNLTVKLTQLSTSHQDI